MSSRRHSCGHMCLWLSAVKMHPQQGLVLPSTLCAEGASILHTGCHTVRTLQTCWVPSQAKHTLGGGPSPAPGSRVSAVQSAGTYRTVSGVNKARGSQSRAGTERMTHPSLPGPSPVACSASCPICCSGQISKSEETRGQGLTGCAVRRVPGWTGQSALQPLNWA